MKNYFHFSLRLIAFCSFAAYAVADSTPVGHWTTVDDATGKPKSIVAITENAGVLSGKIIELINPSEPNPLCTRCRDDKKDQPIKGMTIIWGAQASGKAWKGKILDPKKGKVYKVKLTLKDEGKTLKVRGYIGNPMLGRTQIWVRDAKAQ